MTRIICAAILGLMSAATSPAASAQTQKPVLPSWTAAAIPELATANNLPPASPALLECVAAHRAALLKKPEAVWPLVVDHLGADPVRRDCAMAAEVDLMARRWCLSSTSNGYAPLANFVGAQNKSLAAKSEPEKCQARTFIFDSAVTFNGMMGGAIPKGVYDWIDSSKNTACVAEGD